MNYFCLIIIKSLSHNYVTFREEEEEEENNSHLVRILFAETKFVTF